MLKFLVFRFARNVQGLFDPHGTISNKQPSCKKLRKRANFTFETSAEYKSKLTDTCNANQSTANRSGIVLERRKSTAY